MRIAIPSLSRVNQLKTHTYAYLKKCGIDDKSIYIFVIDKEYDEYSIAFPKCNIVTSRLGVRNSKNYIQDYFPKDCYILQMDDDVKQLSKKNSEGKLEFYNFLTDIFKMELYMDKYDYTLYSVYPCPNPFFMKESRYENKLCYCIGAFIFYKNLRLNRTTSIVEDFEFSVLHHLEGKIIRDNSITVEHLTYTNPGGIQALNIRNKTTKEIAVKELVKKYPENCKAILKRDGWWDIKFTSNKRRKVLSPIQEEPIKLETVENIWSVLYWEKINPTFVKCVESWINVGYKVNLLCNKEVYEYYRSNHNVTCVMTPVTHPDLMRFKALAEFPMRTFIDCDLFLLRKLPNKKIMFSSEQSKRIGALVPKNKDYNKVNIGVLRYYNKEFWEMVYNKCLKSKTTKNSRYMDIFVKLHIKEKLDKEPFKSVCPLSWANIKEASSGIDLNSKYGQVIYTLDDIEKDKDIYGIHLWNSMMKYKIEKGSYYDILLEKKN